MALVQLYMSDISGSGMRKRSTVGSEEAKLKRNERSDDSYESHSHDSSVENLSKIQITPSVFMSMCPALLVQIEQGSCNENTKVEAKSPQQNGVGNYSNSERGDDENGNINENVSFPAWVSALVSVFLISICGLFGIAMVPLAKSSAYQEILNFLIACAVGTLCGDALMVS